MSDSLLPPRMMSHRRQSGLSLVELMVGLALGMFCMIAIVQSFTASETFSRATSGRAEAQQGGTLASWRLTRQLRLAGAGLAHGPGLWGCQLQATLGAAQLLPRAGVWPAPFVGLTPNLALAPIAVSDGTGPNGSDQIVIMGALTGANAVPQPVSIVSATAIQTGTSPAFAVGDLLLVADSALPGTCRVGQVDSTYAPLPGVAAPSIIPTSQIDAPYNRITGFSDLPATTDFSLLNLGATPTIQLIGIDDENSLVILDPLRIYTGVDPVAIADNVVDLQVLYGVDNGAAGGTLNDNVIDEWVAPSGVWDFANVSSPLGSTLWVKAIRVAMVMRSSVAGGSTGGGSITLFGDLPAAMHYTITLTPEQQRFTHQVYDTVIPLRNQVAALCAQHRREAGIPMANACR